MKPNWSAAAALARALVVLALTTFFGALALPVLGDGSLPMTWAAWKPVFAAALGATASQELIYVRLHLSQAAQAMGLPVPSVSTAVQTAAKASSALTLLCLCLSGCASVKAADAVAVDLTNAICAPLEGQPAGQPYIDIVCTVAQGVETIVGGVATESDVKKVRIRLPASEAPAFLAAHSGKS